MSTKPSESKSETVRVRVRPDVMAWLRRVAARAHLDIANIVRPWIMAKFDQRGGK